MNKTINTVTVIGANGTMGANMSGIFAVFGDAKVYMVCRDMEKAQKAVLKASKSVRAESITKNLIPADYSMLNRCVAESDLIFESTVEDLHIKIDVTKNLAWALRDDAIICTGTSGLSVTTLSECLPEKMRSRYLGMHFFNPPYSMPLCELIPTAYTDMELLRQLKDYLAQNLLRTVVEVKDYPAFLANRIGFQFINEAMQYAEFYKERGGIDYIDGIMGSFTGRAMAPLTTADFVGLDVHKSIVDNLYANTCDYARDTFVLPDFAQKLIDEGKLGRKSGQGFYKMKVDETGKKHLMVYDIVSGDFREKRSYGFTFTNKMNAYLRNGDYRDAFRELVEDETEEAKLCLEFLLKYILYSVATSREVAFRLDAADDVMATGFKWCPPLAVANALGEVVDLETLAAQRLGAELKTKVDIKELLGNLPSSNYDYRSFFKAEK